MAFWTRGRWEIPESSGLDCAAFEARVTLLLALLLDCADAVLDYAALAVLTKQTVPTISKELELAAIALQERAILRKALSIAPLPCRHAASVS